MYNNPYCIDILVKLPAFKAFFAAYHIEIVGDLGCQKTLDFVSIMRVNKLLDAFHIPASLLVRYGSFNQAFQMIIKKSAAASETGTGE